MESLSSPRLRASAGDFFAVPCSPVGGGIQSFAKISFQFSSAISVRNSGLRAYLKSRSPRQKVHFFNCQTRHFPRHWKPRNLGYKPETNRVSVHDLHRVPSARRGSPTTDPPPQRRQLSPHRCGLRCTPKNPGVTAEGYERAFVAPLDAAPVSRSATDSTLLQRMASEEPRCFGVRAAKRSVDADSDTPDEAPDPMPIRTGFHLVARVDRR
jgi:hypothetical protein